MKINNWVSNYNGTFRRLLRFYNILRLSFRFILCIFRKVNDYQVFEIPFRLLLCWPRNKCWVHPCWVEYLQRMLLCMFLFIRFPLLLEHCHILIHYLYFHIIVQLCSCLWFHSWVCAICYYLFMQYYFYEARHWMCSESILRKIVLHCISTYIPS